MKYNESGLILVENLNEMDYERVIDCPWCHNSLDNYFYLYRDNMDCEIIKCNNCGCVFAKKRINDSGRKKYWKNYMTSTANNK